MKLLIVAMPFSVHTARWIAQINNLGWDIHLFTSIRSPLHPEIKDITLWYDIYGGKHHYDDGNIKLRKSINIYSKKLKCYTDRGTNLISRYVNLYPYMLAKAIKEIKPDIIHSMVFQGAGYFTLDAKKILKNNFPKWLATVWGSGIYHFQKFPKHNRKIRELLKECDYYSCECHRDVILARKMGYKGKIAGVGPITGGFDIQEISALRQVTKPSKRKTIMVKGYHGWAGRALVSLKVLEQCSDLLKGYKVVIYSSSSIHKELDKLIKSGKLNIEVVPEGSPHSEILRLHSQSRAHLALSITDGISASLLEALTMGSFPIQSNTACADEWIKDGETGMIVPPEDVGVVANALKKVLKDDDMVDRASEINFETAKKKLDNLLLKEKAINMYKSILEDTPPKR